MEPKKKKREVGGQHGVRFFIKAANTPPWFWGCLLWGGLVGDGGGGKTHFGGGKTNGGRGKGKPDHPGGGMQRPSKKPGAQNQHGNKVKGE